MAELKVGKPDTKIDASAHTRGVQQGNKGSHHGNSGIHEDGTADARRSTGVQPKKHDAILPIMPNLPPG